MKKIITIIASILLFLPMAVSSGTIYTFNLEKGHHPAYGFPFNELIERLNNARRGDIIQIYTGQGGRIDMRLVEALERSEGHIVTIAQKDAISMGTVVLLRGDTIVVHKNVYVMQHSARRGNQKLYKMSVRLHSWYRSLYTDSEWNRVTRTVNGVWLKGDEVCKRMKGKMVEDNEQYCKFRGW